MSPEELPEVTEFSLQVERNAESKRNRKRSCRVLLPTKLASEALAPDPLMRSSPQLLAVRGIIAPKVRFLKTSRNLFLLSIQSLTRDS
jgi:hypothetical protein